jgi:hypothetical protein
MLLLVSGLTVIWVIGGFRIESKNFKRSGPQSTR